MKRYLLLLAISVFTSSLFAQTNFRFADSTAQWNVLSHYSWPPYYNTLTYKINGDTLLGTTYYQKIELDGSLSNFIRQDSLRRVFYRRVSDTVDFLIYDFGKNPGDTFSVKSQWGFMNPNGVRFYVCAVDTMYWGRPRKRMILGLSSINGCNQQNYLAVEGIGMIRANFLYPDLEHYLFDGEHYQLLCFSENNNLLYHDTTYSSCTAVWNGIDDIKITIAISPNPTTNSITIQSENNLPPQTNFQLYDITGRMVLQKQLTGKETTVPLNEISKGLYVYTVTSKEKKLGSGKLVVQ